MSIDGFYVAYMSSQGYGVAILVFKEGNIAGTDIYGVKFDGKYKYSEKDDAYIADLLVSVPSNTELIQGNNSGEEGVDYTINISLPSNFLDLNYVQIETPLGAVNMKLERIRDLGDL